jgi:sugar phosphate isomerase/epimerase
MSAKNDFLKLLRINVVKKNKDIVLTKDVIGKLISRIDNIKLYAHSYAFALNRNKGDFDVMDLLNFAHKNDLKGIEIHVGSGSKKSLSGKSDEELREIKKYADKLGLGINLDVSTTSKEGVDLLVRIAKVLGAKTLRVYIIYGGLVSEIIKKASKDLKYILKVAKTEHLFFVIEPNEVLKSNELVNLIEVLNSEHVKLLFDFGNMINANENPLDALINMSAHINSAHMKGVKKVKKGMGIEHEGVEQGKGDLPQIRILFELLLLGKTKPQVKYYALEQEVGYVSPPFRFDEEGNDPKIPHRLPSETKLDKTKSLKENLALERRNATAQVKYVKGLLNKMKTLCELILKE